MPLQPAQMKEESSSAISSLPDGPVSHPRKSVGALSFGPGFHAEALAERRHPPGARQGCMEANEQGDRWPAAEPAAVTASDHVPPRDLLLGVSVKAQALSLGACALSTGGIAAVAL